MRGRKPIPTSLHKAKGTFNVTRHGKHREDEPIAEGDLLDPPDWLTSDQKDGWRYAMEHAPAGVLKLIDRAVLAVWVIAEDQHRIAAINQAKIDANSSLPLLVKDKNGLAVASPYLVVINRAALRLIKSASELGFTPAARPRLANKSSDDDDNSGWGQFAVINGGKQTG